jgi:protein-L-isoaspartate(D-aspartate) O-methyltransferase
MAQPPAHETARNLMVDSQVRPNQVTDRRIIAAMRQLPREDFAPAGAQAYADADIPLGKGRYMLAPMIIARLTQLVMANNPAHVLVVGAGSGYGAAILSLSGAHVVALEEQSTLTGPALAKCAAGVEDVAGPLTAGWPAGGPYDVILIEGAVADIPENFASQLKPGGRLITILADRPEPSGLGRAVIATPSGSGFATIPAFDCTARVIPAFLPAPSFVF